jgi:hypothetical protein
MSTSRKSMNDDTRDRIMEKALSGRMGRLTHSGNDSIRDVMKNKEKICARFFLALQTAKFTAYST